MSPDRLKNLLGTGLAIFKPMHMIINCCIIQAKLMKKLSIIYLMFPCICSFALLSGVSL